MITIKSLQELFEKIRDEEVVENLQEYKFNLTIEISQLHLALHDGNSNESKPSILAVINSASSLKEILEDRINKLQQEAYQRRKIENIERDKLRSRQTKDQKRLNIEEANLARACKKLLSKETYKALLKIATEYSHQDINKLRPNQLKTLEIDAIDFKIQENE